MLLRALLQKSMRPEQKEIVQILWNITQGIYPPPPAHLTTAEVSDIFKGKSLRTQCGTIASPFLALHEDMEAVPLKPYLTRSSYDHQYNLKQNAVKELHRKVNILLGIAQNLTKLR